MNLVMGLVATTKANNLLERAYFYNNWSLRRLFKQELQVTEYLKEDGSFLTDTVEGYIAKDRLEYILEECKKESDTKQALAGSVENIQRILDSVTEPTDKIYYVDSW